MGETTLTITTPRRAALITGGTSGIGLATARVLHADGYEVIVTGRDPRTIAAAKLTLPEEVVVLRADARVLADADTVAEQARIRFGKLDLVFLNAGVGRIAPIEASDEALFDEHFDTNLKGQFFTLHRVLPLLGRGSAVIFNSALGASVAIPNWSVYAATKGALLALMHALAAELAPVGIRVNAVSPGPVDTPALDKLGLAAEALEGVRTGLSARIPAGRLGSDEEVARTVAFLGSPAASFINGVNLTVDGGLSAAL